MPVAAITGSPGRRAVKASTTPAMALPMVIQVRNLTVWSKRLAGVPVVEQLNAFFDQFARSRFPLLA